MKKGFYLLLTMVICSVMLGGCGSRGSAGESSTSSEKSKVAAESAKPTDKKEIKIGLAFEQVDSRFLAENLKAADAEVIKLGGTPVTLIAGGDSLTQLQQIEMLISMKVDAIVCVAKDGKAIVSAIKKANAAGIPFITDNRAAAEGAEVGFNVADNNFDMAAEAAQYFVDKAKAAGKKYKLLLFMGDLKDVNAVQRDKGYMSVFDANKDSIEVVTKVPTEWKPELALSGTINALQAHSDIDVIITPSDYLLSAIVSGLQQNGKWKKSGEPGHIQIGAFDGTKEALDYIKDGYVTVDSVSNPYEQGRSSVDAAFKLVNKEQLDKKENLVVGTLVTAENYKDTASKTWAYQETAK